MKNGREYTIDKDDAQSPIGLWVWAINSDVPKVINFDGVSLLSSEIQSIEDINGNGSYGNYGHMSSPPPLRFPEQ